MFKTCTQKMQESDVVFVFQECDDETRCNSLHHSQQVCFKSSSLNSNNNTCKTKRTIFFFLDKLTITKKARIQKIILVNKELGM
jgi:hypothetical protein